MYEFRFLRAREVWQDWMYECVRAGDKPLTGYKIIYNPRLVNGAAKVAQMLRDAGFVDGPVHSLEIGVRADIALEHNLPSLFAIADRAAEIQPVVAAAAPEQDAQVDAPPDADAPDSFAGILANISKSQQSALAILPCFLTKFDDQVHGRSKRALLDAGWIRIEGERVVRTDAAPDMSGLIFPTDSILWTVSRRDALSLLIAGKREEWNALNKKTTNSLMRDGWVGTQEGQLLLTPAGASIARYFGLLTGDIQVTTNPDKFVPGDKAKAEKPKDNAPKLHLTEGQIGALRCAAANDKVGWAKQHGKSIRTTVELNLIVIADETPYLTSDGFAVAKKYEVIATDAVYVAPPEGAAGVAAKKKQVTTGQLEALQIVKRNDMKAWGDLHGKTQNTVIREQWVVVVDGKPKLTESGRIALEANVEA